MIPFRVIAEDLAFPEGPLELPGGDVALVEIRAGTVTRIAHDGKKSVIAKTGGGPNGAALGPDGSDLCDAERRLPVERRRTSTSPISEKHAHATRTGPASSTPRRTGR